MSKKVLILSTSLRLGSNSDLLAQQFAQGARDAGHQVELISLHGKDLRFCNGCMACLKAPRCVIRDDANDIVEKMGAAEVLCFATPVYYYELSGQMKTLLDRANPLYSADYQFRDVYLLTASAEVRARRRYEELARKGMPEPYEKVLEELIRRDEIDTHRAASPLRKAEDAVEVDCSRMTLEEVVQKVSSLAQQVL